MDSLKKSVLDRITRSTRDAVISLNVKTALNGALWMCGVVSVPAIIVACFAPESLRMPLFYLACTPVAITAVAFLYFMVFDPDRLQSEKYRIESRVLDIVQEKGGEVAIEASALQAVTNPILPRIAPPKGEE